MMNLYIHEGVLVRDDNTLKLIKAENKIHWIPIEKINEVNVFSGFTISSEVIELLKQKNISLHLYSYTGRYIGSFIFNKVNKNGKTLKSQVLYFDSNQLPLSKVIIQVLLTNQLKFLSQYTKKGNEKAKEVVEIIKKNKLNILDCKQKEEVMGLEGASWNAFYSFLFDLHQEKWNFKNRNKRPPLDPINSMISFINTLIYNRIETVFSKTDIYTELSFLHSSNQKRNSLVLDIAELYKIDITYRMINRLLNKKILNKKDFEMKDLMCVIKPDARIKIITEFENIMKKTYFDDKLKKNVSLEHSIKLEAYKLLRGCLEGEIYKPIIISEVNWND